MVDTTNGEMYLLFSVCNIDNPGFSDVYKIPGEKPKKNEQNCQKSKTIQVNLSNKLSQTNVNKILVHQVHLYTEIFYGH
jgi:hypothetical protein